MIEVMRQQYALARRCRSILFDFLRDVVGNDGLNRVFSEFGDKSIRHLLEHSAGCYFSWLGFHALGRPRASFAHGPCTTMEEVTNLYGRVDQLVAHFFERFGGSGDILIRTEHDPGEWISATPLELFSHTITHEFHHKGQIVWMTRLLGHVPRDTDLSNSFGWEPAPVPVLSREGGDRK